MSQNPNTLSFEAEQILCKLPPKQRRFVEEYLRDCNGAAAYGRAGYKARTPDVAAKGAHDLLQKPEISRALELLRQARSARSQIYADRVLEELARIAFADIAEVISFENGRPVIRPLGEMSEDARRTIASIEIRQAGEFAEVVKIRFHDKNAALFKLMDHLGLTKPKNEGDDSPLLALLIDQIGKVQAKAVA
ncbi:terminase small subunit [Zavarzinella formosa]|uniref:terminase small subunit n=1 Tax=Zavarzinella formosa TaxID=360055 RepID=UPI0002FBC379|nr:terminase small subunit [Zavarzinella formosa]